MMSLEIEAHPDQSTAEVRQPAFVKLGQERLGTMEREEQKKSAHQTSGLRDEGKEKSTAPPARWNLIWNLPKPRLVFSWFKIYISFHVLVLHIAAFFMGYAKKGDAVEKEDKHLWINLMIFLMSVSTTLGIGNGLHEPHQEDRVWKPLKFLTVAVLTGLNVTFVIISFMKESVDVKPEEKREYANKQVIIFITSSIISMVTPQVVLVTREPTLEEQDGEIGRGPIEERVV